MVYSTCTFSPEENEEIIDWFLSKFKGKVELMPLDIPSSCSRPALAHWKEKKFSSCLRLTKRIIPNDLMGGFFIAKIRKISV
jgi:16S rRNA (cytosine1407-C5)-methyltransferase